MILAGNSSSSGSVTGFVTNIETTKNINKQPCILVARFFTPDLVMNYGNIIGIVTENGGATCHAAILARTMGIPCITGVKDATKLLKTGQMVCIESQRLMETGQVKVMEKDE